MGWEFAQLHEAYYEREGVWLARVAWYPPDGSVVPLVNEIDANDVRFDPVLAANEYGADGWELLAIENTDLTTPGTASHSRGASVRNRRWWFKRRAGGGHTRDVDAETLVNVAWALDQGGNLNAERLAKAAFLDYGLLSAARSETFRRKDRDDTEYSERETYSRIISAIDQAIAYSIDAR